jgi:O-methyltransferase
MTVLGRVLNKCLQPFGARVIRILPPPPPVREIWHSAGANLPHSHVRPGATYSPWLTDHGFRAAFGAIKDHTLIDVFRCYELWHLAKQAAQLPGAIVEVGVWRGGSGCLLALAAPEVPVYLADTFTGIVKAGPKDTRYVGGEHAETSEQVVRDLLDKNSVANARILTGIFPEETGSKITEDTISLLHIDVDVYQSGKDSVEWAIPRMTSGSIIVFDDYSQEGCDGITRLVHELRDRLRGFTFVHNLNGHAILIKSGY